MKVSEHWLKEWVSLPEDTQETAETLTMLGLEVEAINPVALPFHGVIVGQVIACKAHEQSNHLKITTVLTDSQNTVQVVCGASNVAVGLKVPFATLGACLPGNIEIKATTLRGVLSEGMLCGAEELGLPKTDPDGLMILPSDAPVGEDVRVYLDLADCTFDINITPNRADCLSVRGLARELSLKYPAHANPVDQIKNIPPTTKKIITATVSTDEACPLLITRVIENVDLNQSTPLDIQNKLTRSGIPLVNIIIDLTHYVMLEMGQPIQAYDYSTLHDSLDIRYSRADEQITLNNNHTLNLIPNTLLITTQDKPIELAGILGDIHTQVTQDTTTVVLVSAYYKPTEIAGKARSYGLSSESAHRFERGTDPTLPQQAIERVTAMILALSAGNPGPLHPVTSPKYLPTTTPIPLRIQKIEDLLGLKIPTDAIALSLKNLGCLIKKSLPDNWLITPPTWRVDLKIEVDLIEEIIRIQGYDQLPTTQLIQHSAPAYLSKTKQLNQMIDQLLIHRGYYETLNLSFVDPILQNIIDPSIQPIQLTNPLSSDLSVMRTSLIPGLLRTILYNQKRQQPRLRFFERGQCFIKKSDKIVYENKLAVIICGSRYPESCSNTPSHSDFYDIKGDLEAIIRLAGCDKLFELSTGTHAAMHPGQTAKILKQGEPVGYLGSLHPLVLKKLDIRNPIYIFELNYDSFNIEAIKNTIKPISKYPAVRRDMALLVKPSITAQQIINHIQQTAGPWLIDVFVFDVYTGNEIAQEEKSIAFALIWQHASRTLKDSEINEIFYKIYLHLNDKLDATLRN